LELGILTSKPLIFIKVQAGKQASKHEEGRVTQLVLNNFLKLIFFICKLLNFQNIILTVTQHEVMAEHKLLKEP
jgi:hypothetical protein